jgi:hypothetical protein
VVNHFFKDKGVVGHPINSLRVVMTHHNGSNMVVALATPPMWWLGVAPTTISSDFVEIFLLADMIVSSAATSMRKYPYVKHTYG